MKKMVSIVMLMVLGPFSVMAGNKGMSREEYCAKNPSACEPESQLDQVVDYAAENPKETGGIVAAAFGGIAMIYKLGQWMKPAVQAAAPRLDPRLARIQAALNDPAQKVGIKSSAPGDRSKWDIQ